MSEAIRTMETILGMELEVWRLDSCRAEFGVGPDWATLYLIESMDPNKGHATELLKQAKAFYESDGKKFGGTVALSQSMRCIYQKLKILEYKD